MSFPERSAAACSGAGHRLRRLLALVLLVLGVVLALPAGAQEGGDDDAEPGNGIDVVQVDGLLDPANAALLTRIIEEAGARDASLVVVQLAATGAVDVDVQELVRTIEAATVPVGVWVGPSGSNARGASALLALAAPQVAVAGKAGIGPVYPLSFDDTSDPPRDEVLAQVTALQTEHSRDAANSEAVVDHRLSAGDAERLGVVNAVQPTVGDFIVSLDGQTVQVQGDDVTLDTADVVGQGEERRRQPNQEVRFHKLDLSQQVAHTLVTPWVAYFLFVAGFALIVFEFFTAGVGIAGFVGAAAVIGACFGFSHLPVQWWAVGLLLLGLLGLAIDVQAGGLGAWTFIGSAALVAGSVTLYGGSSRLDPSWWVLVLVVGGTVLFMLSGMTAMIRSRFSTPTIGREELIGEAGVAEVDVAPDGVVRIHDSLWRARTNRATPIKAGAPIRVVAVEGIVLEVEPPEGGARDYRDRSARRRDRGGSAT
jgi:membrane-bound serine protease (ClpP class)